MSRSKRGQRSRRREPRPNREEMLMAIAVEVASRSNCMKTHVGCVIHLDGRVRTIGYNGTPSGHKACFDGGCPRCKDEKVTSGEELDRCTCVHAEANALVSAARYGIAVDGTECYVTDEPCLDCTKLLVQSGIARVVWLRPYPYKNSAERARSRRAIRATARRRKKPLKFLQLTDRRYPIADWWQTRLELMKEAALDHAVRKRITKKRAPASTTFPSDAFEAMWGVVSSSYGQSRRSLPSRSGRSRNRR